MLISDLSPRLKELVKPKTYHKDFKPDYRTPIRTVPESALEFQENERLKQLAKSKEYHKDFVCDRPVPQEVNDAALQTISSKRLNLN